MTRQFAVPPTMAVLNADKNWNEYVNCAETVARSAEHTVVLTGVEGDRLYVNDPLDGLRKVWTKAEFEAKWELLDRRAISLSVDLQVNQR